jgi:hypothetical protein
MDGVLLLHELIKPTPAHITASTAAWSLQRRTRAGFDRKRCLTVE